METCLTETCTAAPSNSSVLIFTQLIQTLLTAQCSLKIQTSYPADRTEEILENEIEFDFIVVGGGSAGSVVANRLSKNPEWRVLLIERGEDPSFASNIPGFFSDRIGSEEDYSYRVEPDPKFCQSMKNKQCIWPRGKALGGSSIINGMLYVQGNDRDYNQWAQLVGEDWNYENVLPYFRKAQNYHPDVLAKYGHEYFGTGGPLSLKQYNYTNGRMHELLLGAAKEMKIPFIDILNANKYIGFAKAYGTIDNGVRQNAAKAYLGSVNDRDNLYVIKSARVNSVKVKEKRAIGVEVLLKNGQQIILKASKEVILSAGSVASPQILMLSGIGPKHDLELHNIEVISDLPVGKNLQDHVLSTGILFTFVNKTSVPVTPLSILNSAYEYLTHRTGFLASVLGFDLLGFINTKDQTAKYPNIQYQFIELQRNMTSQVDELSHVFNWRSELTQKVKELNQDNNIIQVFPTLLNPKSVGQLKLKSSNPDDPIKIYANYLDSEEDTNLLLEAIEILHLFVKTNTFRKFGIKLRRLDIPGCEKYATESEDYWRCNLRHTSSTVFHPVGTCKMGLAINNDSVVDPNLKVHNVEGLRVIDASIMPTITSGNINAPTLMIAEKGSDLIKKEWLVKDEL